MPPAVLWCGMLVSIHSILQVRNEESQRFGGSEEVCLLVPRFLPSAPAPSTVALVFFVPQIIYRIKSRMLEFILFV